jgi:hypothetical protein
LGLKAIPICAPAWAPDVGFQGTWKPSCVSDFVLNIWDAVCILSYMLYLHYRYKVTRT